MLKPGNVAAYHTNPARLAIVLAVHGARVTLRTLDTGRTITRPLAACWRILDAMP